ARSAASRLSSSLIRRSQEIVHAEQIVLLLNVQLVSAITQLLEIAGGIGNHESFTCRRTDALQRVFGESLFGKGAREIAGDIDSNIDSHRGSIDQFVGINQ